MRAPFLIYASPCLELLDKGVGIALLIILFCQWLIQKCLWGSFETAEIGRERYSGWLSKGDSLPLHVVVGGYKDLLSFKAMLSSYISLRIKLIHRRKNNPENPEETELKLYSTSVLPDIRANFMPYCLNQLDIFLIFVIENVIITCIK